MGSIKSINGEHKERKQSTKKKATSKYALKVRGVQSFIFNPSAERRFYLDPHQREAKQHGILVERRKKEKNHKKSLTMACQVRHEVKGTSKTLGLTDWSRREKKQRGLDEQGKRDAPNSKGKKLHCYKKSSCQKEAYMLLFVKPAWSVRYQAYHVTLKRKSHCCKKWDASLEQS